MIELNSEIKRTLLEFAFCAVNHRLRQQAFTLKDSLKYLISDEDDRMCCEVLLLAGLHQFDEARIQIEHCSEPYQEMLLRLLTDK